MLVGVRGVQHSDHVIVTLDCLIIVVSLNIFSPHQCGTSSILGHLGEASKNNCFFYFRSKRGGGSRPAKRHDIPESPSYSTQLTWPPSHRNVDHTNHFWKKECLGFPQALVTEKIGFKFHISSGDFTCSFDYNGANPPTQ